MTFSKESLEKELNELVAKMSNLMIYLYSKRPIDSRASDAEIDLMERQFYAMREYATCLRQRMAQKDETGDEPNKKSNHFTEDTKNGN